MTSTIPQVSEREKWGSRMGLILAAAGNAIGIGNILRFPSQVGQNGGGAFMVPYLICLIVFGLPMMWIAWWVGRYGGKYGHGTTPGMMDKLLGGRAVGKYIGVLGLLIPLVFCFYYTYIESWMLGYSWLSLTGHYENVTNFEIYLQEYLGELPSSNYFGGLSTNVVFVAITLALNFFVLARGISKGIETLAKIAIPLLFIFCIILSLKVLFLPASDKGSVVDGLAFIWNPSFSEIFTPTIWLAAAGQIFFTLSIGFGSLECYASYLGEEDDIVLTGLTTAGTNEFVEIIFGSLIAIPATAVFVGATQVGDVAGGGPFNIGMVAMPDIILSLEPAAFFGTIWFLLLFFAAFTSSVGIAQPIMAFLQDELKLKRLTAVMVVGFVWILGTLPVLLFGQYGVLNQLDFFAGTMFLVIAAIIEIVIVLWIFGADKFWQGMHKGADIKVPRIFYYIMKYVTPIALLAILIGWVRGEVNSGYPNLKPKPTIQETILNYSELVPDKSWSLDVASSEGLKKQYVNGLERVTGKKEQEFKKFIAEFDSQSDAGEKMQMIRESGILTTGEKQLLTSFVEELEVYRKLIEICDKEEKDDVEVFLTYNPTTKKLVIDDQNNDRAMKLSKSLIGKHRDFSLMHNDSKVENREIKLAIKVLYTEPYIQGVRIMMLAVLIIFLVLIKVAWNKKARSS